MPISITPTIPVIAAQGAAPDLVLQPGTVVDAQVLKILAADLVRIAINSLSIDVVSEIPLQVGQTLQLAVSQTAGGLRLAVVGQGGAPSPSVAGSALGATLVPQTAVEVAASASTVAVTSAANILTPLERLAVSTATQAAATQQGSLAPLFANLGAVAAIRRPAAGAAAGGHAIAGATHQSRSKSHRQRYRACVPEFRAFSRVPLWHQAR